MKFLTGRQNAMNTANISESDWYEHFESLFSANLDCVDILVNLPNDELSEIEDAIFNDEITEEEILNSVKSLNPSKSAGPDGIPPQFFIQAHETIMPVMLALFNRIFSTGVFPDCWCSAIIIPIYKKGDINSPSNYRGISLLDIFGKIFTNIINRR